MGRELWVVGHVCSMIKKDIYYSCSSLSARSKFVLGLRSCLFREFPVIDKKRVRVRVRDP